MRHRRDAVKLSSIAESVAGHPALPRFPRVERARSSKVSTTSQSLPESVELSRRVAQIVAGDESAKRWLYDTFAQRLYRRLLGRYGGQRGLDPEELLHDAYVSFFQHEARVLTRFVERSPAAECTQARLEAYLWGLACGIASNRRRSMRRQGEPGELDEQSCAGGQESEHRQVDRDTLRRLGGCLKKAGSRIYLYYKLRFVEGRTPEEIASATGWSRKATYKLKLALNGAVERCARLLRIA